MKSIIPITTKKNKKKKNRGHICSLKCLTLLNINQLPHTNWCMKVNVLVCTKHSDEYSRGSHLASSHIPKRYGFAQTQTVPPIIRALISAVNLFCFFFLEGIKKRVLWALISEKQMGDWSGWYICEMNQPLKWSHASFIDAWLALCGKELRNESTLNDCF